MSHSIMTDQFIVDQKIGLFYGSSTCYTEFVAEKIRDLIGADKLDLHNIATSSLNNMLNYNFLIFGIPTWDYGELQEDWEAIWDELDHLDLSGKTCAIFGLGDQIGYADWFQDALGYLYYKLTGLGANLVGSWPNKGYTFNESKGLTESTEEFLGLALDDENQPELTDQRLSKWLEQILSKANEQR